MPRRFSGGALVVRSHEAGNSDAAEFERAASLTLNERERVPLLDRAAACAQSLEA